MSNKKHIDSAYARNLKVLDKIMVRASDPNFWGEVTLRFKEGKLMAQVKLNTTIHVAPDIMEGVDGLLDDVMVDVVATET